MSTTLAFLCALALLQEPAREDPVLAMRALYAAHLASGQSEETRQQLIEFWRGHDAAAGNSAPYLLEKSLVLSFLDEDAESQRVFDLVPDEALERPFQFHNRIQRCIDVDQERALPLLERYAAVDREAFGEWVHESYAQRFAPRLKAGVDVAAHLALLAALDATTSPARGVGTGLREWLDVLVNGRVAESVRSRFDPLAGDELARSERYRLLAIGEAATHDELLVDTQIALVSLVAELEPRAGRVALDPSDAARRARERYVLAQACLVHADNFSRGDDRLAALWLVRAARWAPDAADRLVPGAAFYEYACLGGPLDHRSAAAERLEQLGHSEETLDVWLDLATEDVTQCGAAREPFERLAPTRHFGAELLARLDTRLPLATDFALTTLGGESWQLSEHRGQWVVLDFWGTWCAPCREELPAVEAFHREASARTSPDVAVLTLACRDTAAAVAAFCGEHGFTFPVALGSEEVVDSFDVAGFPTKIVVTPTGRWVSVPFGTRDWRAAVSALVACSK